MAEVSQTKMKPSSPSGGIDVTGEYKVEYPHKVYTGGNAIALSLKTRRLTNNCFDGDGQSTCPPVPVNKVTVSPLLRKRARRSNNLGNASAGQ